MEPTLQNLVANLSGSFQPRTLNGREYLVGPASMIIPGVLNGSKGSLFYPADEIIRSVDAWNGMPITLGHPTENGLPVSARQPSIINKFGIGTVYSANYDGKLSAEAWIDVDACRRKAPDVLNAIKASKPVELSTGLFTEDEVAPHGSVYNGVNGQKSFDYVARNYRPDHLAILLDQRGACSLRDGCGLGVNSNPDGINQYSNGGGKADYSDLSDSELSKTATQTTSRARKSGTKKDLLEAADTHEQAAARFKAAAKTGTDSNRSHAIAKEHEYEAQDLKREASKALNSETDDLCSDCQGAMKDGKCQGCGDKTGIAANLLQRMWQATLNALLGNSNPEGINQYTGGGGGGESYSAAHDRVDKEMKGVVKEMKTEAESKAPDQKKLDDLEKKLRGLKSERSHASAMYEKDPEGGYKASYAGNAFLPNQPRSQVTGKIKQVNAGTGKGPVHEAAQDGWFGGKCEKCGATLGNASDGKCTACEAKKLEEATALLANFDDDQPRDENGKFSNGGGSNENFKKMEADGKRYKETGDRQDKKEAEQRKQAVKDVTKGRKVGDEYDHPEFGRVRVVKGGIEPVRNIGTGAAPEVSPLDPSRGLFAGGWNTRSELPVPISNSVSLNQGDQDMDRTKAISFLVANCGCWKGKERVLQNTELFDDSSVIALAKNAARGMQNEVVVNALTTKLGDKCPTLNEMPAFIKDKIAAKDEKKVDPEEEEVDGEEEEVDGEEELALLAHSKKKATANKGKPMTVEEYLTDPRIPAPIRNAHRHAIKIEEREKQVVVNKLTSAISDPERKAERKKRLMTLELNELYDRLGDVAEVIMNHDTEDEVPLPRYGSGDVIFPNSQTNNEEAETLDLPTMNWAKKTGAAA